MSNRGGRREGAGGKPSWNHGKTKPIRVPIDLADRIIAIARVLDDGGMPLSTGPSRVIDLSGISVRHSRDGAVIKLSDLADAGYQLKPDGLMQLACRESNRQDFELEELLYLAQELVNERD